MSNRSYFFNTDVEWDEGVDDECDEVSEFSSYISSFNGKNCVYKVTMPEYLEAFDFALNKLSNISDSEIKETAIYLVETMQNIAVNLAYNYRIKNSFKKIHVIENSEDSLLIEWNYSNIRAGFSIEKNNTDSSYYRIIHDNETDSYDFISRPWPEDVSKLAIETIDFIVRNT